MIQILRDPKVRLVGAFAFVLAILNLAFLHYQNPTLIKTKILGGSSKQTVITSTDKLMEHGGLIYPHEFTEEEADYFAVCTGNKDQPVDLQEFFRHYYHHMGVRHFYIGDDGSIPPLSTFEYPGVPKESLHFRYYTPEDRVVGMQPKMYNDCAKDSNGRHTWMAFIDEDEFLEMTDPNVRIHDFLKGFEDEGALGVNWQMHGSSGRKELSVQDDRQIFLNCFPSPATNVAEECNDNVHIKTISNLKYLDRVLGPHTLACKPGKTTVGEHHDILGESPWRTPSTTDHIRLHHYVVRSEEEFAKKAMRGNGMDSPKTWGWWNYTEKCAVQACGETISLYRP